MTEQEIVIPFANGKALTFKAKTENDAEFLKLLEYVKECKPASLSEALQVLTQLQRLNVKP